MRLLLCVLIILVGIDAHNDQGVSSPPDKLEVEELGVYHHVKRWFGLADEKQPMDIPNLGASPEDANGGRASRVKMQDKARTNKLLVYHPRARQIPSPRPILFLFFISIIYVFFNG